MRYVTVGGSLIIVLALTTSAQRPKTSPNPACNGYVAERLDSYFSRQAVQAAQIINNVDDEPNRSRTEVIKIGPHTVEWIVKNDNRESSVSLRVNGDPIALGGKQSLNLADESRRLDMRVVGEWRQIKLYKLQDREIIALTLGPAMCTGLMCSVSAQLYYDARSKRLEFFGRYRTDDEAQLYRFSRHEGVFVIAANFDGDAHLGTSPGVITYNFYRLLPDGGFKIEKDPSGKEYWLRHTQFILDQAKPDRLEQHWIETLN
jgi:hypothetical protein